MVTVILIVSYLVFLCRGVPDSIIGAAWPLIYKEFNVSVSLISVLTIGVSLFTALASIMSTKIISKLGTWKALAIALFLMALTILGFGMANSFYMLCILSVPLGFCAGVIDNTLNSFLALRYKSVFINLLHGFYGLGAIISPVLVSFAISEKGNWREGYSLAFYILMSIWLVLLISYPLWKKNEKIKSESSEKEEVLQENMPFISQIKTKPVLFLLFMIVSTNALEYSLGVWASTFFTDARNILPEISASLITSLFLGMTAGRLICAFSSIKISCHKLIIAGISVLMVGCVAFMFAITNIAILYVLMFVLGLANGPIYPMLLSITPDIVNKKYAQSVIGTEIAFAYMGCVLTHILLGFLVDSFTITVLPLFVIVSYAIMLLAYCGFSKCKSI